MIRMTRLSTLSLLSTCGLALALAGCAGSNSLTPLTQTGGTAVPVVSKAPSGRFMGGQQPVAGVSVQLYAVGATGYGSAATALGSPVTSSGTGNFTLASTFCPSVGNTNPYIYIVGTGGTPVNGSPNANIALMAALGQCQTIQTGLGNSTLNISINELTTVAAVWALSPFMGTSCAAAVSYGCIGSSSTNAAGIANAFSTAANLVNPATGGIVVPNSASTNLTAKQTITELGDIVADCINSAGGSASDASSTYSSGTECGKFFFLTTNGGLVPADTITGAMSLAQLPATTNPSSSLGLLHALALNSSAYSGVLGSAPTDYTLAVNYTGGGLNSPSALALDASGNVWVANNGGNSVTMLSNTGTAAGGSPFSGGGTISAPSAIAVDPAGDVWVANTGNGGSITELTSGGASSNNYTGNGVGGPLGLAVDGSGNVWVANSNNSLSGFTNVGGTLTGSPFSGGGLSAPLSVAISSK
jgi:hypothetical protein